jgi:glycogen debranching enzyme
MLVRVSTDAAAPGDSRRPWVHELQVAVNGPVTCLALRDGDVDASVEGAAATGLFVDDRRVVHRLTVRVDRGRVTPLAAASLGASTETLGVARHLGGPGPDPTVEVARRRVLVADGLREAVTVRNRWEQEVSCRLEVDVAGDGADLAEVRHGVVVRAPLAADVTGDAVTWRDERHEVRLDAPGARVTASAAGAVLTWDLRVPAGGRVEASLRIRATRLAATEFDATAGVGAAGLGRAHVRAQDVRLDRTVAVSLTDLDHLTMRDPEAPEDVFAAAGTPWYLTLFGRDALWAARMTLPFGTELARGTLRSLARRQGTVDDVASAEAPGKIPHEIRRSTYGAAGHLVLPSRYYGTIDATALWICLLHDAWRWGMSSAEVAELAPALRAALGWLERAVDGSPDGLLRYLDESGTGLVNQGWKDSADSMRDASGRVASGPVALVEAQAYAVEAALGAAALVEGVLGEDGSRWRRWGEALAGRVRDRFWVEGADGRFLAMALDGQGLPVDGLGSNIGHALGSGLLDEHEEELVADALTGPDLLGPLGISTLSRSNPGFNPIGYHTGSVWTHDTAICMLGLARCGRPAAASAVARTLVDVAAMSGYRWPELHGAEPVLDRPVPYPLSCRPQAWSAASAAAIVSVVLGVRADVPAGTLRLVPPDRPPFGAVRVEGLRVGGATLAVEVDSSGRVAAVEGLRDGASLDITTG